jgi:hypothetical protein
MSDDLDITQPIRDAVVAAMGSSLPVYNGSPPVFTRRPVPSKAPYPMIVISSDVSLTENDGIDDERPIVIRDVAVYGVNDVAGNYREVEDIAYAVRHLFHRQRESLDLSASTYKVIDIQASGPRMAPTDDQQTVGRLVELTVRLARRDAA